MWPFKRKHIKKIAVLDRVTYCLGKPVLYEIRIGVEMYRVAGDGIVVFLLRRSLATVYNDDGDEAIYLDYDAMGNPFIRANLDRCCKEFI